MDLRTVIIIVIVFEVKTLTVKDADCRMVSLVPS